MRQSLKLPRKFWIAHPFALFEKLPTGPYKKVMLVHETLDRKTTTLRFRDEPRKIHMRSNVTLPDIHQGIIKSAVSLVASQRPLPPSCFEILRLLVTIIHDQGGTAPHHPSKRLHPGFHGWPNLGLIPLGIRAPRQKHRLRGNLVRRVADHFPSQRTILRESNPHLSPPSVFKADPPKHESIHQLIAQIHPIKLPAVFKLLAPGNRLSPIFRKRLLLQLPQKRQRLHNPVTNPGKKPWMTPLQGPEQIRCQLPPVSPLLDDPKSLRPPHPLPDFRNLFREKLPEEPSHTDTREKIALPPDGGPARIIALLGIIKRPLHELLEAHGPPRPNILRDRFQQFSHSSVGK